MTEHQLDLPLNDPIRDAADARHVLFDMKLADFDPMERLRLELQLQALLDQMLLTDAEKATRVDWQWFNNSLHYRLCRIHPSHEWFNYAFDRSDEVEAAARSRAA